MILYLKPLIIYYFYTAEQIFYYRKHYLNFQMYTLFIIIYRLTDKGIIYYYIFFLALHTNTLFIIPFFPDIRILLLFITA